MASVDNVQASGDSSSISNTEWIEYAKKSLRAIKKLPDDMTYTDAICVNLDESLPFIAEMMLKSEIISYIREDDELAKKLLNHISLLSINCIKRMNIKIKTTTTNLEQIKDNVKAAFGTITNYIAANFSSVAAEDYMIIMKFLQPFLFNGEMDSYGELPYGPVINLTRDPDTGLFFLNNETLKIKDLVARSTSLDPRAPQFVSIIEIIENLSQCHTARSELLSLIDGSILIEDIIIRIKRNNPTRVRIAVSGIIKNLIFEEESQALFLDDNLDMLSLSLLPILTKSEYTENDLCEFPTLIYGLLLDAGESDLCPDPDPQVRHHTMDFIFRLCATRKTREYLREKNIYVLLREYHKWEPDFQLLQLTERVVNLLIQTEEEIGVEDLHQLDLNSPQ